MNDQAPDTAPWDWSRDDTPGDPRLLAEWREDGLPYLTARMFAGRFNVVLDASGRPKSTDQWIPPGIQILTGPAATTVTTTSSHRLRDLAAMLLDAADALDIAQEPGLHQLARDGQTATAALF